jgi:hypothetical protein
MYVSLNRLEELIMDNKKFAIWTVIFVGVGAATYFIVEGIRLRKATKKLIEAEKNLSEYKSIAEEIIKSGDKEEAEIMLSSITEDEKKLEEAKSKKAITSSRMKTVGQVILNVLPSFLNFLGGVASVEKGSSVTSVTAHEEIIIVKSED